MNSTWTAGILSPILVGVALYFIGVLFGVDREVVRYFSNQADRGGLLVIEPLTTKPAPQKKRYSERL